MSNYHYSELFYPKYCNVILSLFSSPEHSHSLFCSRCKSRLTYYPLAVASKIDDFDVTTTPPKLAPQAQNAYSEWGDKWYLNQLYLQVIPIVILIHHLSIPLVYHRIVQENKSGRNAISYRFHKLIKSLTPSADVRPLTILCCSDHFVTIHPGHASISFEQCQLSTLRLEAFLSDCPRGSLKINFDHLDPSM